MPSEAELFVIARTAVVGASDFATCRGVAYGAKDVPLNGSFRLGFFEKGSVVSFAPSAARSFDLHIRYPMDLTQKVASHL